MYIGELAKSAGASRKAIYLYEELGLIQAPLRKGSYRVYAPETVDQVKTIKCAQLLGFRLKELVEVLANNTPGSHSGLNYMLEQIQRKRLAIQTEISAAQAQLELLEQFEQQLRHSPDSMHCDLSVDSAPKGKL